MKAYDIVLPKRFLKGTPGIVLRRPWDCDPEAEGYDYEPDAIWVVYWPADKPFSEGIEQLEQADDLIILERNSITGELIFPK